MTGSERPVLRDLAKRHGFASAAHVASATKVVRKRLRMLIREVIAETAGDDDSLQAEYEYLASLLGQQP